MIYPKLVIFAFVLLFYNNLFAPLRKGYYITCTNYLNPKIMKSLQVLRTLLTSNYNILFFSLFFLAACTQEIPSPETLSLTSQNLDCDDTPPALDGDLIRNETREELFTIHDLHYSGAVSDLSGLANYYAAINPIFSETLWISEEVDYLYSNTPTDYLNAKLADGVLTPAIHTYTLGFIADLEDFFTASQSPTIEEALAFFAQEIQDINNHSEFCAMEKSRLTAMNYYLQGYVEYLYHFMATTPIQGSAATYRECTLDWQIITCFLIDAGVITVVGGVLGGAWIAGPIYLGVAFIASLLTDGGYRPTRLCCKLFDTPIPDCNPVENIHAEAIGCNLFRLTAFGHGPDIVAWRWANSNTVPSDTITTIPNLRALVPIQSSPSTLSVFAICSDGTEEQAHEETWDLISLQNSPPPNNSWAIAPPNSAAVSPSFKHDVACVFGSSNQISLSWSASHGGGITQDPNHSYRAKVIFWAPGEVTISVKTKNICTGETHTLSKVVSVN